MSETIRTTVSDRGLVSCGTIRCAYRMEVYVQESSAADEPCIWLRMRKFGVKNYAAHMTLPQAERLRDDLTFLINNHYQLGPSKDSTTREVEE